jgi:Tol biopolymer transport system component
MVLVPSGVSPAQSSDTVAATWVFVSAQPQAYPGVTHVTIRSPESDGFTVALSNGGWDPVAIRANPGDTLHLVLKDALESHEFIAAVPKKKGPIIVRTDPTPQKRDVPLNAKLLVVFSEPMDSRSINTTTIQLLRNGAAVGGTVALQPGAPWAAEFTPATLEPRADYVLRITTRVKDEEADTLANSVDVLFTTEQATVLPGSRIGFVRKDGGNSHIYVLDLSSQAVTALTSGDVHDDEPAWSPDGSQLAFTRNLSYRWDLVLDRAVIGGEIWLVNADGSGLHKLADGHSPTWARDSVGRLAFFRGDNIVVANSADGAAERTLALSAFDIDRGIPSSGFDIDLGPLSWSSDGRTFAFSASNEDDLLLPDHSVMYSEKETILLINADGTALRGFVDGEVDAQGSPALSPDGLWLAYWSYFGGLTRATVQGAQRVSLFGMSWGNNYAWSPDGNFIATSDGVAIVVVSSSGPVRGSPIRLAGTEGGWHPTWLP